MGKTNKKIIHSQELYEATLAALKDREIDLDRVAELVHNLQKPYTPELTLTECKESVHEVLKKRELQHALLVGIELDRLAEKGLLSEPLQSLVATDESLFGVDETIAIGATFTYGSIAVTTFGYLDKEKQGIIQDLDTSENQVNTFLDDLVGSIAANAAARIAHGYRDKYERENE